MTFSCQRNEKLKINESLLRGKTFNLIEKSKNDTLTFEFKDSTYYVFEFGDGNIPWRISHYDSSNFLVLDNRVIGIKQVKENQFECTYIGLSESDFVMIKKDSPWNKDKLYGEWIEEKYFGTKLSDLPPAPNSLMDSVTDWPPYYKITESSITNNLYKKTTSELEINNSNEFLLMKLMNPLTDGNEYSWRIKKLNDSIMIIDRERQKYFDSYADMEYNIKLIKKR